MLLQVQSSSQQFLPSISSPFLSSLPKSPFSPPEVPLSDGCVLLQRIQDLLVLLLGGVSLGISLIGNVLGRTFHLLPGEPQDVLWLTTGSNRIRNVCCSGYDFQGTQETSGQLESLFECAHGESIIYTTGKRKL